MRFRQTVSPRGEPATLVYMTEAFQAWIVPVISLLAIVDPVAAVPTFLALTADDSKAHRRTIVRDACVTCAAVLLLFALSGRLIFQFFAITLPAFRIAGGLILGLTALDMLRAEAHRATPDEIQEGLKKSDIAVTPLAIPILAGPGALSTVMVMMSRARDWTDGLPVVLAIAVTGVVTYLVLRLSANVIRVLGQTGINLLSRLMGILLMTISFQFAIDGLKELGLVGGP